VAETAELACDDRAVSFISDPSILARALALVAATNRDRTNDAKKDATNDGPWSLLPAMASPRSKLFVRVQRLARPDELPSRGAHPRRERALSIALVVLSLGSLGVSVQFAPRAEAAPAADTASLAATMTKLFVEESHVSSQLAQMLATLAGLGAAAEEKPAVIELRQDLRHIHQMQAWIEAQLAAATAPSAPASSRPSS
jgi:hypothetical protein